jgi:hypothetical protein
LLLGKRCRREIGQRTMGPHRIVVDPPLVDDRTRVGQADEPVLAQALITKFAIETFDMPILGWLAWRRNVERDLMLTGPDIQELTDKLRAIVDPNALRFVVECNNALQEPNHSRGRQRRIDFDCQTLTREAIDQIECAKAAATRQRIVREVHRPMLTSARWDGQMWWLGLGQPLAPPPTDTQSFCPVEAIDAFMVERTKFTLQQYS